MEVLKEVPLDDSVHYLTPNVGCEYKVQKKYDQAQQILLSLPYDR